MKGGRWQERGAQDLGEWGLVLRVVADWDPERIAARALWPLRELLLAYVAFLKRQALERYENDVQVWATLAPHQDQASKPPRLPKILRS